jgi:predicted acetyltransferase
VPERTVRTLTSVDDVAGFIRCMRTGFLEPKPVTDEQAEWALERWDLDRTWSAYEGKTQCGTARTFPSEVRLPGLDSVPVSCLTQVTVLPTHTRRGHLISMMRAQLEAAVEAGEVASLLIAAEWPIYGRFGYGPATEWADWRADTDLVRFLDAPVGSVELVTADELVPLAAQVLARQQATRPGCIERPDWLVRIRAGADVIPGDDSKPKSRIMHFDAEGEPDGFLVYEPKERWTGMRPENQIEVNDDATVDAVARRELWRYITDVDLVSEVQWEADPADAIRHQIADGRAVRQAGRWDHLWARLLDVPAALTARSYAASDRVVVEVVDQFLDRGGRFALDATTDGVSCAATTEAADVTLPVGALGAAWFGGTPVRDLRVDEETPGGLERLTRLLLWPESPWCATDF